MCEDMGLYRGKRKDNGEWVYGDLIHGKGEQKGHLFIWYETDTFPFVEEAEVIPETVGQSTEMYDEDGNPIFEGDIVRVVDLFNGKVIFQGGTFGIYTGYNLNNYIDYDYLASEIRERTGCDNSPRFCYEDYFVSLFELYVNYNGEEQCVPGVEVIGNIHDNPGLLR